AGEVEVVEGPVDVLRLSCLLRGESGGEERDRDRRGADDGSRMFGRHAERAGSPDQPPPRLRRSPVALAKAEGLRYENVWAALTSLRQGLRRSARSFSEGGRVRYGCGAPSSSVTNTSAMMLMC